MELYQGIHGDHILAYRGRIAQTVSNAIKQFPRTTVLRVDLHYPPIWDNGDSICCYPNLESGAISRFLDSLKAILEAYEYRRKFAGIRVHYNVVRNIWAREFSQSGKCHYHICLFFNKSAYYHLGHLKHTGTLSNMIIRAWYSALDLELEDCRDLVHFPDNCKYILDIKDPDFDIIYNDLINRLDYLTKLDTKVFGEGGRNFGCSRG